MHAATAVCKEMMWCRDVLSELGLCVNERSPLYCDNKPTVRATERGPKVKRVKHLDIECKFLVEKLMKKIVQIQWISTVDQQADLFTKGLPAQVHRKFCALMLSDE